MKATEFILRAIYSTAIACLIISVAVADKMLTWGKPEWWAVAATVLFFCPIPWIAGTNKKETDKS